MVIWKTYTNLKLRRGSESSVYAEQKPFCSVYARIFPTLNNVFKYFLIHLLVCLILKIISHYYHLLWKKVLYIDTWNKINDDIRI